MAKRTANACRNDLLKAIPRNALPNDLDARSFRVNEVFYEVHDPITHLYAPCSGMISVVSQFHDGTEIEVGCVGREGLAGFEALLGAKTSKHKIVGQIEGEHYKIPLARFRAAFAEEIAVRNAIYAYALRVYAESTQNSACNLTHTLEERLARWLLLASDRTGSDHLPLTHEFISQMLGSRRSTVTVATGILQTAGLIRYKRGQIEILDRERMVAVACECYDAGNIQTQRALSDS